MKCSISNIANVISESIPNPAESGFDIFVGLEHYDSGEVKVTRYGSTQNLVTAVKVFRKGDILLARRNVYLKRAGLVDFDGVTSGDSIVLRVKDDLSSLSLQSEDIQMYLPFVLNTEEFWNYAEKYSDGTMSKRLSPKTLLQYEFDIPDDVTEKNRLLWQAYKTKESYKAMITATDEMVKSQFIEILNSSEKKVEIGDVLLLASKGKTPQYVEHSNVRVMNQACVHWDGIHWENVKYQDPGKLSNKEALKSFDILLNSTGTGTLGRCNIFFKPDDEYTYIPDGHLTVLKTNQSIMRPWLLVYFIKLEDVQREIYDDCVTGSTNQVDLVRKNFLRIRIPLPEMALQMRFDKIVSQADKSKFELKQAIEKIDKVMRALMQ